jgi:lipopolysaccharide/colanic/teichoic acid biosynthesis glycosyltransferase
MTILPSAISKESCSCAPSVGVSRWKYSTGKRLLDLAASLFVLLIGLPVTLLIALAVKLDSPGPVFFRQERVGKDRKLFKLIKFRTMVWGYEAGPGLTRRGDSRVTVVGRVLRKWKLDELPQFLNVLRGDMSLVGPRPDLQNYVATLDPERLRVLSLRPGITGAASLQFRNEEEVLGAVPESDLEHFYVSQILPQKVDIDLAYAQTATLLDDLAILGRTLASVFLRRQ